MSTLKIGTTTKGARIWLQGLERYDWKGGDLYTTHITPKTIVLTKVAEKVKGARKVTAAKGGIVDLCSHKITQWAQDSTEVSVSYTNTQIVIRRVS